VAQVLQAVVDPQPHRGVDVQLVQLIGVDPPHLQGLGAAA
jgi:hypothetical protein